MIKANVFRRALNLNDCMRDKLYLQPGRRCNKMLMSLL